MPHEIVGTEGMAERKTKDERRRSIPRRSCRLPGTGRRSVGELANTALIVSLNWRTLENPAAKATSAMGRGVVSMSTRAVCALCARAMAMGPAPTSADSSRSS